MPGKESDQGRSNGRERKRKTKEEVDGLCEGRHGGGRSEKRGCPTEKHLENEYQGDGAHSLWDKRLGRKRERGAASAMYKKGDLPKGQKMASSRAIRATSVLARKGSLLVLKEEKAAYYNIRVHCVGH